MNHFPFVTIIIPTYNRAHMLSETLDSFLSQDYPRDRYAIILVDNNSKDRTREFAAEYSGRISYLFECRQGVHYARNSAAKIATGDILYFTDDDMVADPSLLSEIVKVFEENAAIGSVTGKIIARFETPPPLWVSKYLINRYLSLTEEKVPDEVIISDNDLVYSCHQAVKRDAFFQCGGFNPENTAGVWIGDGETGLGIKLKQAGYQFAYSPKPVIYHKIPQSRMTLAYLVTRVGNQGNCDSYTDYREHRDRGRIIPNIIQRSTIQFAREMARTFLNSVTGNETWRMLPALIAYYHKRNLYDLKVFFDAEFRKLVEVDNWLTRDYY